MFDNVFYYPSAVSQFFVQRRATMRGGIAIGGPLKF